MNDNLNEKLNDTRPRPTLAELLEAVREQLQADQQSERSDYLRRVSAGVVAIAERELADGDALAAATTVECRRFGVETADALAATIRSGALDGQESELWTTLWTLVEQQLKIDNPRWILPSLPDDLSRLTR